mmetsp:Transcript_17569/g.29656  ORF Transcript_17569/g.29656 Transcript_17569/m.29656 type:complete len:183 (-) Transcript_17569:764-1312(-)
MTHQDGTNPTQSDIQPLSKEDRNWLEEAMKEYTFNDSDKLKELCDELKQDLDAGFRKIVPHQEGQGNVNFDAVVEKIDQLMELAELHERNNLNLALCGGLQTVLSFVLTHPDPEVRVISCHLFSACVQNNPELQQFALKMGALKLMTKFVQEVEMRNKEAVLGALSSFLRAENFNSKREFIK